MTDLLRRHITKIILLAVLFLTACSGSSWNNPYPASENGQNILYSSFSERPKHLDPIRSYSSNEYAFIGQIYEPPLQYHFLKRPYVLTPLTATEVPKPKLLDKDGNELSKNALVEQIAYSVYRIKIKPGINYQPHPAFTPDGKEGYLYHNLSDTQLEKIHTLDDFEKVSFREVTVADYVYQMKRMAQPSLHSPILGIMTDYIVGLRELAKELKQVEDKSRKEGKGDATEGFVDLNKFELSGVKIIDRYTYEIKVKGLYPQLVYWLAMPFFAPMPEEAIRFYAQPGLKDKNISLDWYPVGTGAYMLTTNNPNREMVMEKNPNYRDVFYPRVGATGDTEAGLLRDAGSKLPFVDKVVYKLEKETIPYWNKFLQGYYD
ncbi:MAG: ABC transporter substrate-binding protein, partial [Gammaproteobacteria bacterium]|nr:ABC transporter substrate-binding protein [Gammaproteobacteria bacterium]